MSDEQLNNAVDPIDEEAAGEVAEKGRGTNDFFRAMMDRNFLDYASYVIGSRAIPDVDDGLKPVQRRIMWTLYQAYENGRTTKTANIVGNAMHYHPHGTCQMRQCWYIITFLDITCYIKCIFACTAACTIRYAHKRRV